MASLVATQDSILSLDHDLPSLSTFINSARRLDVTVEGTKNFLCDVYGGLQSLVSQHVGTRLHSGIAVSEEHESLNLDPQRAQHRQAGSAGWERESPPGFTLNNLNSPNMSENMSEFNDLEVAELPPTVRAKTSLTPLWVGVLIAVVLFLIVVPGVVLGVVTKQLLWGFALSAFIATVISIFAGLYYHLDK